MPLRRSKDEIKYIKRIFLIQKNMDFQHDFGYGFVHSRKFKEKDEISVNISGTMIPVA